MKLQDHCSTVNVYRATCITGAAFYSHHEFLKSISQFHKLHTSTTLRDSCDNELNCNHPKLLSKPFTVYLLNSLALFVFFFLD